jgi:peptidyl-prolyl cis-trans isomerase SurA
VNKVENEMIKKTILCCMICFLNVAVYSQNSKNKVLLEIDDTPVYLSEFVDLFRKNKELTSAVYDKESVAKDVELFIDYKLKLLEAKELKMHTTAAYKNELAKYREQLALPYLTDDKYIDSLTLQAFERSKKEVRASHILIRVGEKSQDTLKAYQKIFDIRKEILDGADFTMFAKKYSEDPSAQSNGGDLNYFTVFRMVAPFENAAFETKTGEVSEIFRTRFGYHILKVVDVRASKGEIEVAHIMNLDSSEKGKNALEKVYDEIHKGADFGTLAKKYSDDKRSSVNGGKLPKFSMGAMPPPFDEVSFSLSEEKLYSRPFQTQYGCHIVKFIQRFPIGDFTSSKETLKRKVQSDARSRNLANPVTERLKKEYKIAVNNEVIKSIASKKRDSLDPWILKVQDEVFNESDFTAFAAKKVNQKPLDIFRDFVDGKILTHYKAHLEDSNKEFRDIFEEYKNGLLLFDLMQEKIWDVAQKDTLGLQRFYNLNFEKYKTQDSVKAIVVSAKDPKILKEVKSYLSKKNTIDSIRNYLEKTEGVLVKIGDFEKTAAIFPKKTTFVPNTMETYKEKQYTTLVKVLKIEKGVVPLFIDVKGKVSNDYQEHVKNKWLKSLREKHKIKVYKHRFRIAKKLLNS